MVLVLGAFLEVPAQTWRITDLETWTLKKKDMCPFSFITGELKPCFPRVYITPQNNGS